MAILNIITEEDPTLRKKSREVTEITPRIIALLDDMTETLHKAQGAGLAAVQVGVLRRIALVEYEEGNTIELINPEIIEVDGEQTGLEGCLSLPGKWGVVTRPETVTVRAMNRNGEIVTHTASGLGARAFCHEIEHMDGIIYTDRAERMLT
ncbi:MAG: peptide deformylase, partial [Clostridia bacterium]|nr:peptide deformylase [Clostridia bacterium]